MPRTGTTRILRVAMLLIGIAVPTASVAQIRSTGGILSNAPVVRDWPTKLVARVGFDPTVFRADGGRDKILYELYLTNFSDHSLPLDRVEVLNPNLPATPSIATFQGAQLASMIQPVGSVAPANGHATNTISAGGTVIVFVAIAQPVGTSFPTTLLHRLSAGGAVIDGPMMAVRHEKIPVLENPVVGTNWFAGDGPNVDPDNHHRRGTFIIDGNLSISRRFAIDWQQQQNGSAFRGDEHNDSSYFSYGKPILAVADAKVVATRDGMPDNPAGHGEDFHPALPETLDVVTGNTVILDLGDGLFAHYYHLKSGTVAVKAGDHVRSGQVIARLGASGDAREPHLHFEVTNSVIPLKGEGLPYLIRSYAVIDRSRKEIARTMELPTGGTTIDFGKQRQKP